MKSKSPWSAWTQSLAKSHGILFPFSTFSEIYQIGGIDPQHGSNLFRFAAVNDHSLFSPFTLWQPVNKAKNQKVCANPGVSADVYKPQYNLQNWPLSLLRRSTASLYLLLFYLFSCCSSENFAFFTQAEEVPKGRGKKFLFSGTDRIFLGAHTAAVSNSRVETFRSLWNLDSQQGKAWAHTGYLLILFSTAGILLHPLLFISEILKQSSWKNNCKYKVRKTE